METANGARIDRATAAALAATVLMATALGLIFFYVPNDASEGYSQRIFYLHVPIAMTTYVLFIWGALNAARYLWTGDESLDLRSYVPMHLGTVFGTLTLITGSLWAQISWGTWWDWSSTELNSFLIIFLFYCAYFMLRFSVEPGERRARYSAVYALLGVGLIPVSVLAVHLGQDIIHPITFTRHGANMDNSMLLTFLVALAAMLVLAYSMYEVELRGKRLDDRIARLRRLAREPAG
ncbi:MAG TPA: cytochrome c biogenesis protein CcsA [Gaiellales bacterium]|nr:cytochrome c biogenesis protein CcsA [Gaiellales bacterium]